MSESQRGPPAFGLICLGRFRGVNQGSQSHCGKSTCRHAVDEDGQFWALLDKFWEERDSRSCPVYTPGLTACLEGMQHRAALTACLQSIAWLTKKLVPAFAQCHCVSWMHPALSSPHGEIQGQHSRVLCRKFCFLYRRQTPLNDLLKFLCMCVRACVCVCICMCACVYTIAWVWSSENNLEKSVLSYYVGPWYWAQILSIDTNRFYPLSHLASPWEFNCKSNNLIA